MVLEFEIALAQYELPYVTRMNSQIVETSNIAILRLRIVSKTFAYH